MRLAKNGSEVSEVSEKVIDMRINVGGGEVGCWGGEG